MANQEPERKRKPEESTAGDAATTRKKRKLPQELLAIKCADKEFHEKWDEGRDKLNFPHPFRAVLTGPPNTGKSTCVKNIILRADPPFKKVTVIHADPENSKEYDDLGDGVELIKNIPMPSEWSHDDKTLVVVDDIEMKDLAKEQRRALNRLVGYVSTHKNISVCVCTQDWFNIPTIVRRCGNVWILWVSPDSNNMANIGRRIGIDNFNDYATRVLPEFRDSLWIDMTDGTPYPRRKNGFIEIENTAPAGFRIK
jgi:hypothetical protein